MENKIITMYDLMGLIKDNKAPKKIKCDNRIFIWNKIKMFYEEISKRGEIISCCFFDNLNDTVEILTEENDEWEDIKKIKQITRSTNLYTNFNEISDDNHKIVIAIDNLILSFNQLIKNQKYLKEKLESRNEKD